MNKDRIKSLVNEILAKVKLLNEELEGSSVPQKSGAFYGSVDKSSVLFEVQEGVAFLISGSEETDDEDQVP